MARWRVDFVGKVVRTLGSISAPDEKGHRACMLIGLAKRRDRR
jgi:hypothetical protein